MINQSHKIEFINFINQNQSKSIKNIFLFHAD